MGIELNDVIPFTKFKKERKKRDYLLLKLKSEGENMRIGLKIDQYYLPLKLKENENIIRRFSFIYGLIEP